MTSAAPVVTNFTFHGVGQPRVAPAADETAYWIPTTAFLHVLDVLAERDDVVVTVDDGFVSDLEVIVPALQERRMTGHFFPLSGRIDQPGFLGRAGIKELRAAGMSVGVHGLNHRPWAECSSTELEQELQRSLAVIGEVIDEPVRYAACPFGSYNRRSLAVLRRLGLTHVYTSDRAHTSPTQWLQPRFTLVKGDDAAVARRILERRGNRVEGALDRTRMLVKRWR